MKYSFTIKINFCGGIISPGELYTILLACHKAEIKTVRFGLRQQLLIEVSSEASNSFSEQLTLLGIHYEVDRDVFPNVVSSYPAEEIFINNTWLSEGVYKDIFDLIDYQPKLKINISDSNQSFTPMLTGNINWVAAPGAVHFWHLFIRFPKTNVIYEWHQLVYTNDLARMSKHIEALIFENREQFYDNPQANGEALVALLNTENYITKPAETKAKLPAFNLPYYEGLNRHHNKYWLGIYRRDELFSVVFLRELCQLCLLTKVGQLCTTPWKSIIIKNIEEKDRYLWNNLLAKHQINMRHAANELNFQVEDNCSEGLALKNYLQKCLNENDTRTFGICIGIKTRKKSEVFCSILVRQRALLTIAGIGFFKVYDILCAKDFNPNERTGSVFSKGNPKFLMDEQLRRAVLSFYNHHHARQQEQAAKEIHQKTAKKKLQQTEEYVYQCSDCFSVYEEKQGEPNVDIAAGTLYNHLPETYTCATCEAPKTAFNKIPKSALGLQPI